MKSLLNYGYLISSGKGTFMFIARLFIKLTNNIYIQAFRYALSGVVAFSVDFLILFLLTEFLKIYYMTSASIAFILGLLTSYILNIKWVFINRKFSNKMTEMGLFLLIGIIGIILNLASIWVFTEYLGLFYLFSKIIATVIVFLWNFLAKKIILF